MIFILQTFAAEVNYLLENGLEIVGKQYQISIKCFIPDTSAMLFCKNVMGHNSKICL